MYDPRRSWKNKSVVKCIITWNANVAFFMTSKKLRRYFSLHWKWSLDASQVTSAQLDHALILIHLNQAFLNLWVWKIPKALLANTGKYLTTLFLSYQSNCLAGLECLAWFRAQTKWQNCFSSEWNGGMHLQLFLERIYQYSFSFRTDFTLKHQQIILPAGNLTLDRNRLLKTYRGNTEEELGVRERYHLQYSNFDSCFLNAFWN